MTKSQAHRCRECGACSDSAVEAGMCASCVFELALEISGASLEPPTTSAPASSVPPRIPGYEIRETLGIGGMGTVWLGEQSEPIRRTVAIKVVREGFDSVEAAARFDLERQTLALLDHPHVARLFDAGTTDDGQPYFVMEHVPGVPITQFCNGHRMSVERRVQLFADVCETVHYAHQKGILHRDLKPSNVLVVDREGTPVPKVIDFGIAKAIRPLLFDHASITRSDLLIGTPEYMSPEQLARGDVDVRSDVYSLGAILYELLAGTRPFDPEAMARMGLEEALRTIREVDAPTPSARVTSRGAAAESAALARATGLGALVSKLRGDLDWITMKALAKEPSRRYGSAVEFAEDQRRFLRHEPVAAGPPGIAYRARKFVRRNPAATISGAVLLLSLIGFGAAMTIQADRVSRERDRANDQAAVSQEVTEFLVDLFWVSDPSEARGNEITAREVLDRGAARVRDEITHPTVRAQLVGELGVIYRNLGLLAEAEPLLKEAAELQVRAFGRKDPRTLKALHELAGLQSSRGHSAVAESLYLEVMAGWRTLADDEDPRVLDALHDLAIVYREQDRMEKAEESFHRVLEVRRRSGRADDPATLAALTNLAVLYKRTGRLDLAEPLFKEALVGRRRLLGEDHPRTLLTMSTLGDLYSMQGRHEEAEALLRETAAAQIKILGSTHPDYGITLEYLASSLWMRGEHERAVNAFSEIVDLRRSTLGGEHPKTLIAMHNLGSVLMASGDVTEAERIASETLEVRRRTLGDDHRYTVETMHLQALIAMKRSDPEAALSHLAVAVRHGLGPAELQNSAFETLRSVPEFRELLLVSRRRSASD